MEPTPDPLVLTAVVVAVIVGIYLLRHVIVLAFRLMVLAALVLGLVWVWQQRGDLMDAAGPYLRPVGERLGALSLSGVRHLLADLLSGADGGGSRDGGASATTVAVEPPGATEGTEAAAETAHPEDPRGRGDPDVRE